MIKSIQGLSTFALLVSFGALPALADDSAQATALDQGRVAGALAELHHINQKEIKLAQLAMEKTQSANVKSYAQKMISDHQAADAKVQSVAQNEGLTLKPFQPSDCEESKMDSLKALSGSSFDQAYLDAMNSGHKMAYSDLKMAESDIKDPAVKDLLKATLPTVKDHQKMAENDEHAAQSSSSMKHTAD